jgi:hypothetical protein
MSSSYYCVVIIILSLLLVLLSSSLKLSLGTTGLQRRGILQQDPGDRLDTVVERVGHGKVRALRTHPEHHLLQCIHKHMGTKRKDCDWRAAFK